MTDHKIPFKQEGDPFPLPDPTVSLDSFGTDIVSFTRAYYCLSKDAMCILDMMGCIQTINRQGLQLLGFEESDTITGLPWVTLWPRAAHRGVVASFASVRGGLVARCTLPLTYRTALELPCAITLMPFATHAGNVESILAIFRPQ